MKTPIGPGSWHVAPLGTPEPFDVALFGRFVGVWPSAWLPLRDAANASVTGNLVCRWQLLRWRRPAPCHLMLDRPLTSSFLLFGVDFMLGWESSSGSDRLIAYHCVALGPKLLELRPIPAPGFKPRWRRYRLVTVARS
jgi:hypothetical protein